jgi:hypothetical protein
MVALSRDLSREMGRCDSFPVFVGAVSAGSSWLVDVHGALSEGGAARNVSERIRIRCRPRCEQSQINTRMRQNVHRRLSALIAFDIDQ